MSLSLEKPDLSCFEPGADAGNREGMLKFPQEQLPFTFLQRSSASGSAVASRNLPSYIFQPAVLLSPPRQKNSQEFTSLQNGEISLTVIDLISSVACYCFNLSLPLEMNFLWKLLICMLRGIGPNARISCFCT